jgi:hypothetical protein
MSKNQPPALPNMSHQWDVAVYDLQVPRSAPKASTPARREAIILENAIRHNPVETGAFFRSDGSLITKKVGTATHVHFDKHELTDTAGSLFTHNHPNGFSFSREDLEQAIDIGLVELRAVTDYCRYILHPKGNWPTFDKIEQGLLQHAPAALQEVQTMAQSCQLSNSDTDKEIQHRLWVLVSNDLNLHYEREPS